MNKLSSVAALTLIIFLSSCKQEHEHNLSIESKIDSLFQQWDKPNTPGAAVGVLKDGELIFAKGYGMANLEHNIPITSQTIFHIASESKQYTNFCIAMLAEAGKLSLDDDIRQYLPYVPDFGKTITIRHLIHHTSGLRDQWQLLSIAGTRIDDVIKQEHVINLVKNQKELNFEPGSRYLYCNTGYTLLAEIVKAVSGKSLRDYAHENIFQPLGMHNTHFHDNYTEIVKGRANSYTAIDSATFRNSVLSYSTVGATSLFTTIEDEAKWLNNFYTAEVGAEKLMAQMH
ncbi:MAG TPA: serine hydrolase domain-containing protein [Cyclobacteriaceae bacterium]|nr:serine hydrolase domain-containing protein [Cyclobacteriaceae bacterium]